MAATDTKLFANVPQLKTEKDWPVWKFQVTHALKAAEQWEYAKGTVDQTQQGYQVKEEKAFYSILQCIGQRNVPAVMNCKTTKELWDTLCQIYERKTVSNKVHTLMQLYGQRMKRGSTIHDHLRIIDELSDQLTALGETVSELNKVAILLKSVQENYPTLVTALLARGDDELTFMFAKQALLDEEQRRSKGNSTSSTHESPRLEDAALKARTRGYSRKPGVCFNCGKAGHYQKDCRKPRAKHRSQTQSRHHADKAETAPRSSSRKSSSTEPDDAQMFFAHEALFIDNKDLKYKWIIDSGASKHMTFQRDTLRNYRKFNTPELVGLGDGRTVEALGSGDIKFVSYLPNNKRVVGWMNNVLYVPQLASNLFSVRASTLSGNSVSFGQKCWIRNKKKRLIGTGSTIGKLYVLNCDVHKSTSANVATEKEITSKLKIDLWHQRLAHVNIKQLRQLTKAANGIDITLDETQTFCEACIQGKMHRLPHPPRNTIRSTEKLQLVYSDTEETKLVGYSDADWANDLDDRHSTSGNVFIMTGGAISWQSQKQQTVALSTTEAEYMALGLSTQEAIWLNDLHISTDEATEILEDNQGAIAMTKNPIGHKRTKHIDIKHHFVRENVLSETITITYCPTDKMVADIFTKPLPKPQFENLREKLGY